MYQIILTMEQTTYDFCPQTVIADRLGGYEYVTLNFGVEPTEDGFKGYASTITFADGQCDSDRLLDRMEGTGIPLLLQPEEFGEVLNRFHTADPVATSKRYMRMHIEAYDSSDAVNQFSVCNTLMWLDKSTRSGLKLRLEAEQAVGKLETTLWYGAKKITLPTSNAVIMLNALEIYACACYDNTHRHLASVGTLQTVEDILAYDYKAGYPEKLMF